VLELRGFAQQIDEFFAILDDDLVWHADTARFPNRLGVTNFPGKALSLATREWPMLG
jgi:hypothetical protein